MHYRFRSNQTCLNCGTYVPERYCPHCGQENIEPKLSTAHLVKHFFEDITHYDSKFFLTIRLLITKPGFLTKEYFSGKRASYLDPVRMYVFISFFFFLVLLVHKDEKELKGNNAAEPEVVMKVKSMLSDSLRKQALEIPRKNLQDSARSSALLAIADSLTAEVKADTTEALGLNIGNGGISFSLKESRYGRVTEYDSAQAAMPPEKRNPAFLNWLIRTNVKLKEKYGSRSSVVVEENFNHNIPKLMFLLLPVFALFVYWMHNRKKYSYPQHLIYAIHVHAFTFLILLIQMLLLMILPGGKWVEYFQLAIILVLLLNLVLTMRTTYDQSAWWALLKSVVIFLFYLVVMVIAIFLLALFIFFTA